MIFATAGFKYLPDIAIAAGEGILRPAIGLEIPFSDALTAIRGAELGQLPHGRVVLIF
jgi:hypothetical protein